MWQSGWQFGLLVYEALVGISPVTEVETCLYLKFNITFLIVCLHMAINLVSVVWECLLTRVTWTMTERFLYRGVMAAHS